MASMSGMVQKVRSFIGALATKGFSFSTGDWRTDDGTNRAWPMLGEQGPNWAGQQVNVDTAQNLSTVFACRRIICETQGSLPFELKQKTGPDTTVMRDDLPIYEIMANGNDERSSMSMRSTATSHVLFQGNAFFRIYRRSGGNRTALDLDLLQPEWVTVDRELGGLRRIRYVIQRPNYPREEFFINQGEPHDIFHIRGMGNDGLIGYSVLSGIARQSISSALAGERHWGKFLASGARTPFLMKKKMKFANDAEYEAWAKKWRAQLSEPFVAPIIEGGEWDYTSLGANQKDIEMLSSRAYTVPDLSRFFGVSPFLIGEIAKANAGSLESLLRQFQQFTMQFWATAWESDFRRCVLTPAERRAGIFARHSFRSLLRADINARFTAYSQALNAAWINRNEVRAMEDMPPKAGLDAFLVQQQYQPIEEAGNDPTSGDELDDLSEET